MGRSGQKSIVLAGGGVDSAVCMYLAREAGTASRAIHFDHGQVAAKMEWNAVQQLAIRYDFQATQLVLEGCNVHNGGEAIGRNCALIHLALLQKNDAETLIHIGIHKGTSFYDCSTRFFELCSILVSEQSDGKVRLVAPLLEFTKREIVDFARQIDLPFSETYSCQAGGRIACGICLSCLDREALGC